jgi:hypothetical protein
MLLVAQVAVYTTHKYSVGRTYNCWMLNLLVHRVTRRLMVWRDFLPFCYFTVAYNRVGPDCVSDLLSYVRERNLG